MDTYLDTHFSNFDAPKVAEELRVATQTAQRAEREWQEARRAVAALQATMDAFHAWQASHARIEVGIAAERSNAGRISTSNGESQTGRKSILALIEGGSDRREWTIPSVADALGLGQAAHHAIGVTLSRLARDGTISRPRKGVYTKLAPERIGPQEGAGPENRLEVGPR
jgi:predicted phage tail protein